MFWKKLKKFISKEIIKCDFDILFCKFVLTKNLIYGNEYKKAIGYIFLNLEMELLTIKLEAYKVIQKIIDRRK